MKRVVWLFCDTALSIGCLPQVFSDGTVEIIKAVAVILCEPTPCMPIHKNTTQPIHSVLQPLPEGWCLLALQGYGGMINGEVLAEKEQMVAELRETNEVWVWLIGS
jgi:hypothetical protein